MLSSSGYTPAERAWESRSWQRWNTRRQHAKWLQARCLRCSWKTGRHESAKQLKAEVMAHVRAAHPKQGEWLTQTVEVRGHCIRCAGAVWTDAVERPVYDPTRADEPTFPVSDGISNDERLPFEAGWLEFVWTGKRPPHPWRCPQHDEGLRFVEARVTDIEGRPPPDFLPSYSRWRESNPDFEWRPTWGS